MDEFIPQALSNMAWACASFTHKHGAFLEAVGGVAKDLLPRCSAKARAALPQRSLLARAALATVAACASVGAVLMARPAGLRAHNVHYPGLQTISNFLWSYSVLSVYPLPFFTAASREIVNR
jgi:hypothetical protein